MNFWRALVASLLSLICTLSVSAFVILATLQTTVLDRQVVKTWLSDSGVYKNAINTAASSDQTIKEQTDTGNVAIPEDTVKTALNQTFSSAYVQQQTEKVLDSVYTWLDGKQSTISFDINTTTQKDDFVKNLAEAIKPKIAALPACATRSEFHPQNPTCVPPGANADELARSIATDAGDELSIFKEPITNETVAQANTHADQNSSPLTSPNSDLQQLPNLTANIRQWLLLLPIIAVVSGGLMILASRDHLKAAKHLAGRLTFGFSVTLALGLVMVCFGGGLKLSGFVTASSAVVSNIIEPIFHQAVPAIGARLAWVSGIAGVITLILWLVFQTLWENRERAKLLTAPDKEGEVPINTESAAAPKSPEKPIETSEPKKTDHKK
jgi:hypothetical protein